VSIVRRRFTCREVALRCEHKLDYLRLESSLTAEPFYQALGYRIEARGELMIASGVPMAAITMSKRIADDRRRTDD
jgi:hypothetical protein